MVRLKAQLCVAVSIPLPDFNSTMVRLKGLGMINYNKEGEYFNSTMVRLKATYQPGRGYA